MLTQAKLQQLLCYSPKTGALTWRVSKGRAKAGSPAGAVHKSGYLQVSIDSRLYLAHRLAWLYTYGSWPAVELDHRNRNRLDNRLSNLRPATRKQNGENLTISARNSSGRIGVYWLERVGKWYAQIRHHGRQIHLGYYADWNEAVAARAVAERQYFTHRAH